MTEFPMRSLSPEAQQRLLGQLYGLLGRQVKSYHRYRRMGENTSVPVELAQELLASMEYTLAQAGGLTPEADVEKTLAAGQAILKARAEKAVSLLELVAATAPAWQTECRWEAICCLRQYLAGYDPLHLAHRGPEALFYPILAPIPEGLQGLELCLFYLNVLWAENQILAAFDDETLALLWDRLDADTLNQCEQVLANALGKALLGADGLIFTEAERRRLRPILLEQGRDWQTGAELLCQRLALADGNAAAYVRAAVAQLLPRLEAAAQADNLHAVLL